MSKRDAMLLGARFELGDAGRVGRPRVVGQRVAFGGAVVDEVEEDAASADTVVRSIWRSDTEGKKKGQSAGVSVRGAMEHELCTPSFTRA